MTLQDEAETHLFSGDRTETVYKSTTIDGYSELLKKSDPAPLAKPHGPRFGKRHSQTIIYFLLIFFAYSMRVNLSVGIVAMTDPTASANPDIPTYHWTDKSIVLSAFFWGYILPQIGAGWLSGKYGAKWFLIGSMGICSTFSLLLPTMAAMFGSKGVMASRALQGLSQGFIFPSMHNLLAQWVPLGERSRLSTFVYAAGPFGTVVSMMVTGLIASSWYGWPMVFYFFGACGLGWVALMTFFGHNGPAYHPSITDEEKLYIETSLGRGDEKEKHSTPWRQILTSPAVWAILLTQCGQNWGFWLLLTEIPVYMSHVMNFNIKSNSLLSALPYFVMWCLSFVFSTTADMLINRKIVSIGVCRKIFNTIGLLIPAIALICLGSTGSDETTKAIILLVLSVGVNSASLCGFNCNHMDLSPNHAGTIMGITNGTSNIFGILAPLMVQVFVKDETNPNEWKTVFYLTSTIYVLASIVFIVLGSGEVQPWNDEKPLKEKEKSKA